MTYIIKAALKWFSAFVFVFLMGFVLRCLSEIFMFGWNLL